jgi:predicted transcriptional regulator
LTCNLNKIRGAPTKLEKISKPRLRTKNQKQEPKMQPRKQIVKLRETSSISELERLKVLRHNLCVLIDILKQKRAIPYVDLVINHVEKALAEDNSLGPNRIERLRKMRQSMNNSIMELQSNNKTRCVVPSICIAMNGEADFC